MDKLTLKVAGQVYGGWKSVTINHGIEQVAGTFALGITERWPGQATSWAIPPGELCEVLIGDDPVINGYVDAVSVSYDAQSHDISVKGRDRTGDIVDCSAPSVDFKNQTFDQIAQALLKPYNIRLTNQTKSKPISLPKNAMQQGESVFRTLEKIVRSEGALLISDRQGGLIKTRAGAGGESDTVLKFGENILRAQFEHSYANLYSNITVKGQVAAPSAERFSVTQTSCKGSVSRPSKAASSVNSQITRYRPLVLVAETQADAKRCLQRAQWKASTREAKARRITITVQGWRQRSGKLWQINQTVRVTCPWMRVDERWLIAATNFKLDSGGSLTDLTLVGPNAYNLLPEIPAPNAAGKFAVTTGGKK